jgi:hypothetical protein
MRKSVIIGLPPQTAGPKQPQGFSKPPTCVRKLKRFPLMYGDMADSLYECISTASYKIRERVPHIY